MPQERSFWRLVCDAAARVPERVVLADDYGRTLTTAQLRSAAERVAAGLRVRPGMVVSWQLPTTLEACVLMGALARGRAAGTRPGGQLADAAQRHGAAVGIPVYRLPGAYASVRTSRLASSQRPSQGTRTSRYRPQWSRPSRVSTAK
jgi:hypothetical protein